MSPLPTTPSPGARSIAAGLAWLPCQRALHFTPSGEFKVPFHPELPLDLRPIEVTGDHPVRPNWHEFFELFFVWAGHCVFTLEDQTWRLAPGDLVILRNRELHAVRVDHGSVCRVVGVHFPPEFVCPYDTRQLDFEYLKPFLYRKTDFLGHIERRQLPRRLVVDRILRMHQALSVDDVRDPGCALAVKTCLFDLLLEVYLLYARSRGRVTWRDERARDYERLRPVLAWVEQSYRQPVVLEEVAKLAHLAPGSFSRFFRTATGMRFTEYVHQRRVGYATKLVLEGRMSLTEIAYEAGFSSHSHFDRIFKRVNGVTPREYRHRLDSPREMQADAPV